MERFFKIGILILGILFLIVFYQYSQNGRFSHHIGESGLPQITFDSRTGKTYQFFFDKDQPMVWMIFDPITSTMTIKNNQKVDLRKK